MATISWTNPAGGDWDVASNWSTDTVPTSSDDVTISAPGAYTVTISSFDQASSLVFDAPQAEFVENAGELTIAGAFDVESGLVSLNEANTIGGVVFVLSGVLDLGNPGALGGGTLSMSGGELLATADESLSDRLFLTELRRSPPRMERL
jgi:hypothetical protein